MFNFRCYMSCQIAKTKYHLLRFFLLTLYIVNPPTQSKQIDLFISQYVYNYEQYMALSVSIMYMHCVYIVVCSSILKHHLSFSEVSGPDYFCSSFFLLRSPCKISEPQDNHFQEKSKNRRRRGKRGERQNKMPSIRTAHTLRMDQQINQRLDHHEQLLEVNRHCIKGGIHSGQV